jgi:pilus assembly protein CpaB
LDTAKLKIMAIIAAVVTAAVAFYYVRGVEASKPVETTAIEAAVTIPEGTQIRPEMLKEVNIYAVDLLPSAARTAEELVGQYAATDIYPDEQISTSKVSDESASSSAKSFSYKIPEGMRTVTISIDPTTSVAGMLQVGDHVDILATYTREETKETEEGAQAASEVVTKFIADSVEIAALDQTIVRDNAPDNGQDGTAEEEKTFTTVTMFVTPELAKAIVWQNQNGSLVLTLRSPDEKENPDHEDFTTASLEDF